MNRATSVYLDLVRFLAAVLVLLTHLAYARYSGGMLLWLRTYGNDAVMIFFVLSGFVIAHVAATRDHDIKHYFVNRLARIYSVAVPAIVLTVVLDQAGRLINPEAYAGFWYQDSQPLLRILTAVTFTNELWFSSWRLFTNGPYWSVGYEFWYYALFAVLWYLRGALRVVLMLGIALLIGPKILMLFPIWMAGVWVYRRQQKTTAGPLMGWSLFLGSFAGYLAFRLTGTRDLLLQWSYQQWGHEFVEGSLRWSNEFLSSYLLGALVLANFSGFHAISTSLAPWLERHASHIQSWAGYTFSIYLFHYPLLQFLAATGLFPPTSPLAVGALGLLTLFLCRFLGDFTEKRKDVAKRLLLRVFRMSPKAAITPVIR
jgi:peptidoglycan/LPS O-acetylase OafA/YrhL